MNWYINDNLAARMDTRTTRMRQTNADFKGCAMFNASIGKIKKKSAFVRFIRVVRVSILLPKLSFNQSTIKEQPTYSYF